MIDVKEDLLTLQPRLTDAAILSSMTGIPAIVWGLLIAVLLVRTRSLGACIVAHAVTNFLLGAYVLYTREWFFW